MKRFLSWWQAHGGPLVAGLVACVVVGVPVAVTLFTASQVKWWHWLLGAIAALAAGVVAYATTHATNQAQANTILSLDHTKKEAQAGRKEAEAGRELLEQAHREMLAQVKNAEAQRASTATAMAAVAGLLSKVVQKDGDAVAQYPLGLAVVLKEVLPADAAPLRVTFLSRRDGTDGPVLAKAFAVGYLQETPWEIPRGDPDAVIAETFSGPPWNGALLIDDVTKPEYRRVGALVLLAPDEGVRAYFAPKSGTAHASSGCCVLTPGASEN